MSQGVERQKRRGVSFKSRTEKWEVVGGMLERRVDDHWGRWDDGLINEVEVLN